MKQTLATPGKLLWEIMDTPAPGLDSNIIVSPSEINDLAIGSDGMTFYAVDIPGDPPAGVYPNGKIYKSTDGGISWTSKLTSRLPGTSLPVWNIAVAPDDINFVVGITDDAAPAINGPSEVSISEDGGYNWQDTAFPPLAAGEYISCVHVSKLYADGKRDIAIGTRTGAGTGRIYVRQVPSFATWINQNLAPSGDVVGLKFSPSYNSDLSLVALTSTAANGTLLNLGTRDLAANTTTWNTVLNYPVKVIVTSSPGTSPNASQIITADLELPSDFLGQESNTTNPHRRYYISTDVTVAGVQKGIYRVDNTMVYRIGVPISPLTTGRISSIAYYGSCANGDLLAGEVEAVASKGKVNVWRTSQPTSNSPRWFVSDLDDKSPTGGGTSGFASSQLAWIPSGTRVCCATSSANPTVGGAGWVLGQWPRALLNSVALDESGFSVSLDGGIIWNQLGLIDTGVSFLSDVAGLIAPEAQRGPIDYNILYLASINNSGFDSIWRTTGDLLGRTWERILCTSTSDAGLILRAKQTPYSEEGVRDDRSRAIAFADLNTNTLRYSSDEGQMWKGEDRLILDNDVKVADFALSQDKVIYVLSDSFVYHYKKATTWIRLNKVDTRLDTGHTIAVPLKNPPRSEDGTSDWVIVGEKGPPNGTGRVAYADFAHAPVTFGPSWESRIPLPVPGNAHVITDDEFEKNKIIYAASDGAVGKTYRWSIDESIDWEKLDPRNNSFYGLAQRKSALYGVWNNATAPPPPPPGVDRTLYPRIHVPPPVEWDDLTEGLTPGVVFTREPSSLKISSNKDNYLWAIDNRPYNWATRVGCLWAYTDSLVTTGPWTTAPASGDFIPVDPVTGRATEINFKWRELTDAWVYELQLAKDDQFSLNLMTWDSITPSEPLSPSFVLPPGDLEVNHKFYWRVRARQGVTREVIRSPWSATMSFTVKAGLPVRAKHPGLTLLNPTNGDICLSTSPSFSWSPIPVPSVSKYQATPDKVSYQFILAKDAAMTDVVAKAIVSTTAYQYKGKLEPDTAYFWQVRVINPIESDFSPVTSFTTGAENANITTKPLSPTQVFLWTWAAISTYLILVVAMLFLIIFRSRSYNDDA